MVNNYIMKRKLVKKAYEINFSKVEEGYLYCPEVCYAETRNKAKSLLLAQTRYESIMLRGEDDEVTYLTIPVIRCKHADKYEFEGMEKTKGQIEDILAERKRIASFDEILDNDSYVYCYIRKNGRGYYKPNSSGYTDFQHRAGVYTKEEGVSSAKGCRDIWLERIDIDEHNQMIDDEIKQLKWRRINDKLEHNHGVES